MWSAGVLMNTSRFVLWFCVSDVSNIIICEKLRDENFWFWFVLLIVCLMVVCRRGDDKICCDVCCRCRRYYFFCSLWRRWTYKYTLNKNHLRHSTMNFWFGFWLVIVCFFYCVVRCDFVRRVLCFYLGVFLVHLLADFIENICYKFTIVLCI